MHLRPSLLALLLAFSTTAVYGQTGTTNSPEAAPQSTPAADAAAQAGASTTPAAGSASSTTTTTSSSSSQETSGAAQATTPESNAAAQEPQPTTAPAAESTTDNALPNAPTPAGAMATSTSTGHIPLQDKPHHEVTLRRLPVMFGEDAAHIFIAPAYIRGNDLKWLLPLAGASVLTFSTDTRVMRDVVSHNPDFNKTAGNISDYTRDAFVAMPVYMGAVGQLAHNEHMRESGILGGEAMVDAYIVDAITKLASFRERPNVDNARGNFYVTKSGVNSSFISGHAMITWASAAVLLDEYPSPFHQFLTYTAATAVSVDRVLAQQHFPTDVLIGSAAGWLIGHYVYRAHHHYQQVHHK